MIIGDPWQQTEPVSEIIIAALEVADPVALKMPKDAVKANFNADKIPFYAHV